MKKVLFGGAFDLMHAAHVRAIEIAKTYGDHLTVAVMSDARLFAKHARRPGFNPNLAPVIPELERCEIVAALRAVDEVYCPSGDADYPVFGALEYVRPQVLVLSEGENGGHLEALQAECLRLNCDIVTIPRVIVPSGLDTTGIIKKIQA